MTQVIRLCIFVVLLANLTPPSISSNILFFHLLATSSHRTSIWPLVQELGNRGHNITYIFPAKNRDGSHPNIEDIAPSKMLPIVDTTVADFDINIRVNKTTDEWVWKLFTRSIDACEAFYDSPEVIQWLARPNLKYDLVFFDEAFGECVYGLVYRFQAKHVLLSTILVPWVFDGVGVVPETSSIPEAYFYAKPDKMGLVSRIKTTISPLMFRLSYLDYLSKIEPIIKAKLSLPGMPSLTEIEQNTSLVMYNGHFIENYPLSLPPMMVSYSGLWCSKKVLAKTSKPLPEDVAGFISKSKQGFIYISFGSAVIVSDMPESILKHFLQTFEAFPNIQFLWRWTGAEPKNFPKNVLLKKWFPQRDILQHKNILGFITQAGRPSTQEAVCFGVPLISFPIFADQNANANRLEQLGVSLVYETDEFASSDLQAGIKDLIENPSYKTKMRELSTMFRDRLVDPLDNAVYWTEYVLKYNTSLLKPLGMKQTWWQRRLLDVYAAIFLGLALFTLIALFIIVLVAKQVYKIAFTRKVKSD